MLELTYTKTYVAENLNLHIIEQRPAHCPKKRTGIHSNFFGLNLELSIF